MDINQITKKAQELQNKMQEMKKMEKELEDIKVTGSAGSGNYMVKITLSGKGIAEKCEIDKSLLNDKDVAEDLIAAAFNNARGKVESATNARMQDLGLSPDLLTKILKIL